MSDIRSSSELERAVLQTIVYADIFDYPLTRAEIQRYLIGFAASQEQINRVLRNVEFSERYLSTRDGYITLAGRETIIETRRRRATIAGHLWPIARHFGQLIARLPFVRMVAVTGSLAVDNAEAGSDIDYLIVTQPNRLWLCRLFVIALVKWAMRRGYTLCPNYLITENVLVIHERNLFTAHELVQMVPVAGLETYRAMRRVNSWTNAVLPNAGDFPPNYVNSHPRTDGLLKKTGEAIFQTPPGRWINDWEMNRKIRKLMRTMPLSAEARFSPDMCKGHFDGHHQRILNAYHARLGALSQPHVTSEWGQTS